MKKTCAGAVIRSSRPVAVSDLDVGCKGWVWEFTEGAEDSTLGLHKPLKGCPICEKRTRKTMPASLGKCKETAVLLR